MTLSPLQKQIAGHVLGALVNALVFAYVKNEAAQVAALGFWASIATALHIPRPQDSSPAQLTEAVKQSAVIARNTSESVASITEAVVADKAGQ